MINETSANVARLNMLIEISDGLDNSPDKDILCGLAINADDLESFLLAIERIAKEHFGAFTYNEILEVDTDDTVLSNAFRYFIQQNTLRMYEELSQIIRLNQ